MISFVQISTSFNQPIGIDHHSPTNSVVLSVNYSGGQPLNFERILADGTHVPFSNVAGFTDEVKIGTIRESMGGFTPGDLFVGNGVDGEIVRITDDGNTVINPWVSLPGNGNGLMRGSLHHDLTGEFGYDLIVCTTAGQVWRLASDGTTSSTPLASLGVHLEGLMTIPNDTSRYGPLAGRILCGAEGQGLLHTIDVAGATASFSVGVNIEDIDIIRPGENFFGINFGTNRVLGVPAASFDPYVGDLLLTQEFASGTGLFRLVWDGSALVVNELTLAPGSEVPGQWEHVCFSPAGITPLNGFPFFDASTPCAQQLTSQPGVPLSFAVTVQDNDVGDSVTLTVGPLPPGSTMSPVLPISGNPLTATFDWTPGLGDAGPHTLDFTATDSFGLTATCQVMIDVEDPISTACMGMGCPCANDDAGAGCQNGTGVGGLLTAAGTTVSAADDLVLTVTQIPPNQFGIVYMAPNPDCSVLGDGLRAGAPGPLGSPPGSGYLRFPIHHTGAGTFTEGPGLTSYSVATFGAGSATIAGSTWFFQAMYRDPLTSPCGTGFNLTNGLEILFY